MTNGTPAVSNKAEADKTRTICNAIPDTTTRDTHKIQLASYIKRAFSLRTFSLEKPAIAAYIS